MKNLINNIRNATLMGVGILVTAVMAMFGVFVIGGVILMSLVLVPLGFLAMLAMPKMENPKFAEENPADGLSAQPV